MSEETPYYVPASEEIYEEGEDDFDEEYELVYDESDVVTEDD